MADPTTKQRKAFANMGWAMPDGSYYIRPNVPSDLTNAIAAVGRASGDGGTSDEQQRDAVRRHIMKRATDLKRTKEIPPTWNPDGTLKHFDTEAFIEHFGRKGMKWGAHVFGKEPTGSSRNKASHKSSPDKTASPDAKRASQLQAKVSESGTKSLNNKDLQDLVTRMNLEQQYSRLSTGDVKKGQNFVQKYNGHAQTGLTAFKVSKDIAKVVGPLIVAGAAAAAASKAGGRSGTVKMPRLAISA